MLFDCPKSVEMLKIGLSQLLETSEEGQPHWLTLLSGYRYTINLLSMSDSFHYLALYLYSFLKG